MIRFLSRLLLVAALLLPGSILAATPPTTPISIGTGSTAAAAGSYSITTSADCPIHSVIGVLSTGSIGTTNPVTNTTDSAGNTYVALDTSAITLNRLDFWYVLNSTVDLPNGGTITITYGTTGNRAALFCIPNMGPTASIDVHNNISNGTGASPATTVSTGTLPSPVEYVFGLLTTDNNGLTPVVTPSAGFTVLSSSISTVQTAYAAYQIAPAPTSISWSPTWTQATTGYNSDVIAIKAAGNVTPVSIGSGVNASATSVALTTTGAVPQGALLFVIGNSTTASEQLTTVGDGGTNAYTLSVETSTDALAISYGYIPNAAALPIGSTITCGFNGAAGRHGCSAFYVTGMALASPIDFGPTRTSGAGATSATPIATGTLNQPVELLVGAVYFAAASPGTFTPGGSFALVGPQTGAASIMSVASQTVNSTATVSWSPTWVNSVSYRTALVTFKGFTQASNLMLMGVGQ